MARDKSQRAGRDQSLFDRVANSKDTPVWSDLSPSSLCAVTESKGVDFATALLYQAVRESAEHGEFIREIETLEMDTPQPMDFPADLVIVPGAFHRKRTNSGADGALLRTAAAQIGLPVRSIPIHNFGRIHDNAAIIREWLLREAHRPIVLVSLSKGSSDIKTALFHPAAAEAFRNVRAWVSLSGIPYGTPMARWVLSKKPRELWYRFLLSLQGCDSRVVRELDYGPQAILSADVPRHPQIQMIHVIGFPLLHHMTNALARRCYRRIRSQGPNDGGGIRLADTLRLPGVVYPVWGADHYLRPAERNMTSLIQAILRYLSMQPSLTVTAAEIHGVPR